ncbi:MAG: ATP-binding protein [Chloroflexi bacterium]|nr:ATP-binding protein [Chloroflexota bacterium]
MRQDHSNLSRSHISRTALSPSDTQLIEGLMHRNAELKAANDLSQAIIRSINQALVVLDGSTSIVLSNQRFGEVFRIEAGKETGMRLGDVFPSDRVASVIRQVMETGEPIREVEAAFSSPGGEERNFLVGVSRLVVNLPNPMEPGNILVTFDEVTEWKRRQQQVMEASRLVSIGEMAAGIAHEINNPLAALMGFSQLVMRRNIDDTARRDIEKILAEAKRASKIIANLQSFARRYKPRKDCVNVADIVKKVLDFRAYEFQVNNIGVVTSFDPATPQVMGDEHQLEQVFLNIAINAEYFMAEANRGGTLAVHIGPSSGRVRLSFSDNGPGIAEEVMPKIFDPFFTTKEVGKGTGLGLSICYGIIHEHHGTIAVSSAPGKGATFIIELPAAEKPPGGEDAAQPPETQCRPGRASVLIVEDEPSVAGFIAQALKEEGYLVETSYGGDNILKERDFTKYDVIVLDMKMPGVDGAELFEHVRRLPGNVASRVLFITGDTTNSNTRDFIAETGNPWLTKPFTLEKLLSAVGRVAANRSHNTTP